MESGGWVGGCGGGDIAHVLWPEMGASVRDNSLQSVISDCERDARRHIFSRVALKINDYASSHANTTLHAPRERAHRERR